MLEQLRKKIVGPAYPILPAFTETGEFDEDSTAKYIRYLVKNGARVLLVTAGTSRLNLLSKSEIKQFNAILAKNKATDGVAIAANPDYGSLASTIEIAKAAEAAGADAFLLYYSERYYDDDAVFDYFSGVADACQLPLLIHAMPMRGASTGPTICHNFDTKLVKLLTNIPAIIGMKEENGNEGLRQQLLLEFSERMAIIVAGGGMGKFLTAQALGAPAYLTGLGNLNPNLAQGFFNACQNGDFAHARNIVRTMEQPFFDIAVPMGWHVALKGALNLVGLMPIFERRPLRPPSQDQLKTLSTIMTKLGIGAA